MLRQSSPCWVDRHYGKMFSVMQSSRTLREAMTKKGRCSVSGNGPLMFPQQLDVVADAANVARTRFAGPRISEVREKSETSEHNSIFGNKTAGRGSVKPGSGRSISVFPHTSGTARRKYAANSGTHEHVALFTQRNRR